MCHCYCHGLTCSCSYRRLPPPLGELMNTNCFSSSCTKAIRCTLDKSQTSSDKNMFNWVELADRDALSRASLIQEPFFFLFACSADTNMKSCSQQINLLNSKSKDQGPNISAISANSKEGRSPGHDPGYRPATVNVTLAFLYQQYKTVSLRWPSSAANQSFYPT